MKSDIDRGYAWVIVASNFLSQTILGGSCIIYGQFYLELLEPFHDNAESLMVLVAVQSFMFYCCCLFAGFVCTVLSPRVVANIGVFLSTAGFIISGLANHLGWLILGYGLLIGLATSGIGFGVFAYSPLVRWLIQFYSWRGAFVFLAAVYMQCFVFAALMRPPYKGTKHKPPQVIVHKTLQVNDGSQLYSSNISIAISHRELDVDSKTTQLSLNEGSEQTSKHCGDNFKTCLLNTFDVQLFLNVFVLLHFIASMTIAVCTGVPYNFLPVKCLQDGLDKDKAALIMSMMGVMEIIGRAGFGLIGLRINATLLYAILSAVMGVAVICLWVTHGYIAIFTLSLVAALGIGGIATVSTQSIVNYVGVTNFSKVFGFMMMGKAVGYGAAGPFGAYLAEKTESQSTVFLVVGLFAIFTFLLLVVILILTKLKIGKMYTEEQTEYVT